MKYAWMIAALGLALGAAPALADRCKGRLPPAKARDEQSVRAAEHAWLAAEMQGDVDTLQCLLDEHYTNLSYDGKTFGKPDILQHAAKSRGQNRQIPVVPLTIRVDGDSATAYSVQDKHDQDGKPIQVFFADTLVYRDGAWHAYFSVDAVAAPGAKIRD